MFLSLPVCLQGGHIGALHLGVGGEGKRPSVGSCPFLTSYWRASLWWWWGVVFNSLFWVVLGVPGQLRDPGFYWHSVSYPSMLCGEGVGGMWGARFSVVAAGIPVWSWGTNWGLRVVEGAGLSMPWHHTHWIWVEKFNVLGKDFFIKS